MKNKIIIDEDDLKEYRVLLKIDTNKKNHSYIIYTDDSKTCDDEVIAYAGVYSLVNGKQQIKPIEDDYTLEFLDSVLLQVQKNNKEGIE